MAEGASFALIFLATFCLAASSQTYSNYSSGQHALDIIQASLTGHMCALFGSLRHFRALRDTVTLAAFPCRALGRMGATWLQYMLFWQVHKYNESFHIESSNSDIYNIHHICMTQMSTTNHPHFFTSCCATISLSYLK
jgi:hypothetical protein